MLERILVIIIIITSEVAHVQPVYFAAKCLEW